MDGTGLQYAGKSVRQAARTVARLDALGSGPRPGREQVLAILKEGVEETRGAVRAAFEAGQPADIAMRGLSASMDRIAGGLFDFVAGTVFPAANPTTGDRFALVAQGGYGRGNLAPYSDLDLLFLLPWKVTPRVEQIVEYVLLLLWDTGLKVGHATRSADECLRLAGRDTTICTSLLETRFLWGEAGLYDEFRTRFADELVKKTGPEFAERKLAERDERHLRFGDSRYVVEPNVKEGKGGLRDLHTLYWIAKYLYRVDEVGELAAKGVFAPAELAAFVKSERFLSTVRCHLHYLAGRAEERLTFDLQQEIAARLGYRGRAGARPVERFMKHYYLVAKKVGDLTRIFCAALEDEHRRKPLFSISRLLTRDRQMGPFTAESGWLTLAQEDADAEAAHFPRDVS